MQERPVDSTPSDPEETQNAETSQEPTPTDPPAEPEESAVTERPESAPPPLVEPELEAEVDPPVEPAPEAPPPVEAEPVFEEPAPLAEDEEDAAGREEFARLLAESEEQAPGEPVVGDKVTGTIVSLTETEAFVDAGGRSELSVATSELQDADGKLTVKTGDTFTGYVVKDGDHLALTMAVSGKAGMKVLEDAHASGTPVEGTITQTNKGGLSVDLGGKRGFCPFSQIDLRRVDDPERFVGRKERFKILELSPDGRNIVVSRRAVLEAERAESAAETREAIAVGASFTGTVTRLVPYGAFVDIGGVEGLVHVSQISHQRVNDPSEYLREGQEVRVQVLEVQNLGDGRSERVSLSIKALADDPWPQTAGNLPLNQDTTGKVTRLMDFGAFVELEPGIEGLVHISELANRRILHPREVLNEGEEITVRVLSVDLDRRRISLSRRQAGDYFDD